MVYSFVILIVIQNTNNAPIENTYFFRVLSNILIYKSVSHIANIASANTVC